jgi:hypothetical protein
MEVGRDYITLVAPGHTPANTAGKVDLTPSFVVDATTLKGATFIAPNVGSSSTATLTIGGTYVAGDVIKVTITSNDPSRQLWRKTYTYTVQAGLTSTASIASGIQKLIQADGDSLETPYNATVAASVVTVTAKEDDKHALLFFVSTTSAAGTIVASAVSTTISEGQPSDLLDKGVSSNEITLVSYDTVRILYEPLIAQPFIDTKIPRQTEIFWYGTPGEGSALATLINSL